jgi:hypothetical protein
MKIQKKYFHLVFAVLFVASSCNKKTYPTANNNKVVEKAPTPISAKEYAKEQAKKGNPNPPKVIVVNKAAAKKTANGKYYYEINGYRYWKNNKDGKYYLDGIFPTDKKE